MITIGRRTTKNPTCAVSHVHCLTVHALFASYELQISIRLHKQWDWMLCMSIRMLAGLLRTRKKEAGSRLLPQPCVITQVTII